MKRLNIAFFGAPFFAARVLQKIIDDKDLPVNLACVVTQPDRPSGREQILAPTPVKLLAQKNNILVFDSLQLTTNHQPLKNIDLALLYAYGEIIPAEILKIPLWGFWNIHPSLLPKYRNTSPIVYSLLLGDKTTGVSLIEMDERLDHGPIIAQKKYAIQANDTRESLENKLSDIGYELFKQSIQLLIDGMLQKKEQNHTERTFTRLLTKKDGFVPFSIVQKILKGESLANDEIPQIIKDYYDKYSLPISNLQSPTAYYNLFRALSPWPGLWTLVIINGVKKRLKITGMSLTANHQPLITHVQLEGKKEVDSKTFLSAYHILS